MNAFLTKLLTEQPIITDGAWGTQIQSLGLAAGACPDLWNLENPSAIEKVATAYVDAGSRIILTNTFGASRIMLERHGLSDKAAAINRAGAEISRKAAANKAFVFGSIGPTGKLYFTGEIAEKELSDAFEEQAMALAEGGAQGIVIETISELDEAKIALKAARKTGLPVVVSMVYDSGKEFDRTMMGTTPEEAAHELHNEGADVIGANCGMGIEFILTVTKRLRAATDRPVWIKPNAGLPEVIEGKVVYNIDPAHFAAHASEVVAAGADFIGGCCGTSPAFISLLKRTLSGK
ncbi:MAG: homocysteine S-methyltransferase family protein [Ignavibacteriales bacterium]|nr:homocysteine S-methyltransferase family protein [Ignavibacteriales bacterium]